METEMSHEESFIVDWQDMGEEAPIRPFVALRMRGRNMGLYRVKAVGGKRMLLDQRDSRLPVGAQLEVGDVQGLIPNLPSSLVAQVVASDRSGLSLAW